MYEVKKCVVNWCRRQVKYFFATTEFLKTPPSRLWVLGVIALASVISKVMSFINDHYINPFSELIHSLHRVLSRQIRVGHRQHI